LRKSPTNIPCGVKKLMKEGEVKPRPLSFGPSRKFGKKKGTTELPHRSHCVEVDWTGSKLRGNVSEKGDQG